MRKFRRNLGFISILLLLLTVSMTAEPPSCLMKVFVVETLLVLQESCSFPAAHSWIPGRRAGSRWECSARQGCCSYLSLAVRARVLAPLHPPRPAECVRSHRAMRACSWQQTQSYVCVCACLLACVLDGQRPVACPLSQASLQAMPWARKQEATSREGKQYLECLCVFVDISLHICVK